MSVEDDLRQQIRHWLRRAGYTQAHLARTIGISQKHVSFVLNGRSTLSLALAQQMLNTIGYTLSISIEPAGPAGSQDHEFKKETHATAVPGDC